MNKYQIIKDTIPVKTCKTKYQVNIYCMMNGYVSQGISLTGEKITVLKDCIKIIEPVPPESGEEHF